MAQHSEDREETVEEIKERYGFGGREFISIDQVRELYEKEDVELSAPLEYTSPFGEKIVFRLSLYKGETETGFTGTNGLQLNVEIGGEGIAHAFLENDVADDEEELGEGRSGWSLNTVIKAFKIPPDAEVWEIGDAG